MGYSPLVFQCWSGMRIPGCIGVNYLSGIDKLFLETVCMGFSRICL